MKKFNQTFDAKSTKNRIFPPSLVEIDALKRRSLVDVTILFADFSKKKMSIDGCFSIDEAILKFCRILGLKNDTGFNLFIALEPNSMDWVQPLLGTVLIGDIFADQERKNFDIVFRKEVNFTPYAKATDPVEVEINYAEAVDYVVNGKCPISEDNAIQLAAIQLQVLFGDHNPKQDLFNIKNFTQFYPKDLISINNLTTVQQAKVIDQIKATWTAKSGSNALEARQSYLTYVREWPLYGSTVFSVEQRKKPKDVLICFNPKGLYILNKSSVKKDILKEFPWNEVSNWRYDSTGWHLTCGSLVKPIKFQFSTKYPHILTNSIEGFLKQLAEFKKIQIHLELKEKDILLVEVFLKETKVLLEVELEVKFRADKEQSQILKREAL